MKKTIKSKKVYAGKYEVTIQGISNPFVIRQELNNFCEPTGEWQLLHNNEWMDTLPTKTYCLDVLRQMVQDGDINQYINNK